MEETKPYTVTEKDQEAAARMGSLGGKATMKKYGKKHFKAISKKAAIARKAVKVDKKKKPNGKQR